MSNINRSIIVAKKQEYSDIDLSLMLHPIKKDIIPLTDRDAIKQSVKNLVLTNFYERPFDGHWKGADLISKLFELNETHASISIQSAIKDVLKRYEPRVKVTYISVVDNSERNSYDITIQYIIRSSLIEDETNLYLTRLR